MATSDSAKEEMLEELFKDRFTEKDIAYFELKSKPLSSPTVVYPWKLKKQWFRSWDYSRDRHGRDHSRDQQNRDRSRSRYDRDNYSNNSRDRSQDAESSQYQDRHRDGRESYRQRRDDRSWNRDEERDHRRNYHRDRD